MVDAVPTVIGPRGRPGRPRKRPAKLHGDKGYDYPTCRQLLRRRGITSADRPPSGGVQHAAGSPPLEGRAVVGLAAGQPAPDGPLRGCNAIASSGRRREIAGLGHPFPFSACDATGRVVCCSAATSWANRSWRSRWPCSSILHGPACGRGARLPFRRPTSPTTRGSSRSRRALPGCRSAGSR